MHNILDERDFKGIGSLSPIAALGV
jgi:hypothetical protein